MKNGKSLIRTFLVAVLAVSTLGMLNTALADNQLVNGDFESGDLTGWVVAGQSGLSDVTLQSGDNGPSGPGTTNAYMNNMAEAMGLTLKQTTENGTASGGSVQYSFDLMLDQADAGGVLFVEIFAEQEGVGIIGGSGLMGPFWPWGEWANIAGTFEAPEGTTFFTIQFMANTGAAAGSNCVAHVDNVVLDQGTVADEQSSLDSIKALYR